MRIGVLGPLDVRTDAGDPVQVTGARVRALLARLAVTPGESVLASTLIDGLWGDDPPAAAANALQALVSRLRRALPDGAIASDPGGYRLAVSPDAVDAHEFEQLVAAARADADDAGWAAGHYEAALALWRGPALTEFSDLTFTQPFRARLDEMRLIAIEDLADARLRMGNGRHGVTDLESVLAQHPTRERTAHLLMRTLAADGRPADALAVYERLRSTLAEHLGVDPSPELADLHLRILRGTAVPERTGHNGDGATLGSRGDDTLTTNLRSTMTSFIGRDDDIARVGKLVAESRLVTLTGPGGSGKTRLAVESAQPLLAEFPDGVWMVELSQITDPAGAPSAVLAALGLRERALFVRSPGQVGSTTIAPGARADTDDAAGADAADLVMRLVDALAGKHLLLLLDNCEHLVDDVARVVDHLLGHCSRLRILATSREPLNITGEVVWPVGPLAWPASGTPAQDAAGYPAIRLFADRASAAYPGFELDDHSAPVVADICRTLDGMPLAIELAAARLRTMTLDQVAGRLDDRFHLLAAGSRVASPRHQTLRDVVDWSWSLLSEDERTLLRRLAYFTGGATPDAAKDVMAIDGPPYRPTPELLASLTDKSLLILERSSRPRYRMLETIKAFGLERLAEAGEVDAVRRAHGRHFMTLAESAEPHLRTGDQLHWLEVLDADRENLHAAVEAAIDAGDAETAVRLVAALGWYWSLRADRLTGYHLTKQALAVRGEVPIEVRALAYTNGGLCAAFWVVDDPDAETWLATAVELADQVKTPTHPMLRLARPMAAMISSLTAGTGTWHVPDDLITDPDPWVRSSALIMRAYGRIAAGEDHEWAGDDVAAAIDATRTTGDRFYIAVALTAAAELDAERGEFDTAIARTSEALELVTELDSVEEMTLHRAFLARLLWLAGHRERAMAALDRADRDADRIGLRDAQIIAALTRADLYRFGGDAPAGHDALNRAEKIASSLRFDPYVGARLRTGRGYVAVALGAMDEATTHHRAAIELAASTRDAVVIARSLIGAADLAFARGDAREAAWLLAAADSVRGAVDRSDHDATRIAAGAQDVLGTEGYAEAYQQGRRRAHTREQACERASVILGA